MVYKWVYLQCACEVKRASNSDKDELRIVLVLLGSLPQKAGSQQRVYCVHHILVLLHSSLHLHTVCISQRNGACSDDSVITYASTFSMIIPKIYSMGVLKPCTTAYLYPLILTISHPNALHSEH